ncbi:RelA/SpoT family protein [Pseudemcibacter aquimaris]|uniref:RelA/SpoT family protein n=1 Tax=Pseudemcibacter aquimaris TaxID=2857064 RepID=UPI00201241E6|nr:bifunctional (p)ppGpp synthetase/guanosine-3',5'-bis(diphosphate) 3'-pyrophosphohydrolase [Pseudemcibacter aquimaris]MCC3860656.1 bifunctional (p)ppGpp synthetase/guanosine-3',5'-bis(diphosphate) 3'-pyrophosphohydrolase [Pseudemcibacter aquimaris]WDU59476.1 bifunctional (p)ppGpp synthetase/guanosine-3',5'-bis(diphosphate) 3'-pyrophosphohydrolase [Pseudemcibacter aquimaris]
MIRQFELVDMVKAYDPDLDEMRLNRAYVFSMKAHGMQKRASGDPYFSHPLEVAGILTEMQLDCDTIVTALLHDTIEDTVATYEQIEELFGQDIAKMVDGVTKLSELEYTSESSKQAENFRKFLLAMSNDIRVLLVKLADRLHNMRTLHYIKKPEKRARISRETLDIYAPLAERIGMQELMNELEDLAFPHVYPEAHESIMKRLDYLYANTENVRDEVIRELEKIFAENFLDAEVIGRRKQPYSIWKKITYRNVSLENQADLFAFRVIVDDIEDCYKALGVVHKTWQAVPGLLKDYISMPKPNGYQSLHTVVIGPQRKRIEVQIRSTEMDIIAEKGVAAHWRYKNDASKKDGVHYRWLQDLLEIMEHAADPEEFLEHTKIAMYQNQVFCFTPKGELINLPAGATVVDFAYAVHTKVGDTCVGGKVNGEPAQLNRVLANGDQIEILRSNAQKPHKNWEQFVATGKAKAAIRRYTRQEQKKEYIALGEEILKHSFEQEEREYNKKAITSAAKKLNLKGGSGTVFEKVGSGEISDRKVLEIVFPSLKNKNETKGTGSIVVDTKRPHKAGDNQLPIKGLTPGLDVHISKCCHPLPGDRIVGIVAEGKGIMVHTIDCEALDVYTETPEDWLDLSWSPPEDSVDIFQGRVDMSLKHMTGAMASVLSLVAQDEANVSNIKINERSADVFRIELDLEVRDAKHLTDVITALRASKYVSSIERAFT